MKKLFVLLGLAILSQISMLFYGNVKATSLSLGAHNLSIIEVLFIILIILLNIWILIFFGIKIKVIQCKKNFFIKKNITYVLLGGVISRVIAYGGTMALNINGISHTANDSFLTEWFANENTILIILLLGVAAPIMEEIVFRGGIIGYLFKDNPIVGIMVSSILFGVVHWTTDIISFFIYVIMGLLFSIAYFKTKRLEVSIAIHFLNNILPALVLAFGLS